jgi:Phage integrase, N-terminal SAM-like domain
MRGWIVSRTAKDGSKRYDAAWRVDGKVKTKTFARKKDASQYLTNTVKKLDDGTYRDLTPITFKAYADKWLAGLAGVKPSTARDYRSILEHALVPAFGSCSLGTLTVDDVNGFLAKRGHLETTDADEVPHAPTQALRRRRRGRAPHRQPAAQESRSASPQGAAP